MSLYSEEIERIARRLAEEELRELSEKYPEIQSFEDMRKLPFFNDIYSLVKQGYTLLRAYETAKVMELIL